MFVNCESCGLKFKCLCGVSWKGCDYFGSDVGERDMFVYKCDEAATTSVCSVMSECSVSRKLWCIVSWREFSFLDKGYMYVMLDECVFEFVYLVSDPINVEL